VIAEASNLEEQVLNHHTDSEENDRRGQDKPNAPQ